jgi:hypothetical protein
MRIFRVAPLVAVLCLFLPSLAHAQYAPDDCNTVCDQYGDCGDFCNVCDIPAYDTCYSWSPTTCGEAPRRCGECRTISTWSDTTVMSDTLVGSLCADYGGTAWVTQQHSQYIRTRNYQQTECGGVYTTELVSTSYAYKTCFVRTSYNCSYPTQWLNSSNNC